MRKRIDYPMGSISSGTMRAEDLIPTFCYELEQRAKHDKHVSYKTRRAHAKLVKEVEARMAREDYEDSKMITVGLSGRESMADDDLDSLFDALGEYAAPYFYFGAHPGDGTDYGYWLSESWDEDFADGLKLNSPRASWEGVTSARVYGDTSNIPNWYRGEVAVVNDHGNVSLYVKTSRGLREIWSVV